MPEPFNPTHAVRFELGRGRVSLDGTEPRVLVSTDALLQLCVSAGHDGSRDFGRRFGTELGRRVAARISGDASIESVLEHLGGELALAGFGSLGIERWGRALVFTLKECPFSKEGDALLAAVLEGAIQRALSRDAAVVLIDRAEGRIRLVVVSRGTAASLERWLSGGVSWGDALSRLNAST
jgi:hypothetical protein